MLRVATALRDFLAPIQTINENAKTNILNRIVNKPLAMNISEINYDAAARLKEDISLHEDTNRAKIINTLVEYISYTDPDNTTFDNSRALKFMMLFATTPAMSGELRTEDYKNLIKYAALCGNFEAIRIMSQLNAAQEPNGFEKVINDTELLRNLANEDHEHAVYTILRAGGFMLKTEEIKELQCSEGFKEKLSYLNRNKTINFESLKGLEAYKPYPEYFDKNDHNLLNDILYFSRAEGWESTSYYNSFYKTNLINHSKYGLIHETLFRPLPKSNYISNIYDPKLIILNLQKIQEDIKALEEEQLGVYNTTLDLVASYVKFTARLITKQTKTFEQYSKEIEALQKISDDLSKFAFAHRDKNGAIYINEDWNIDIETMSLEAGLRSQDIIECNSDEEELSQSSYDSDSEFSDALDDAQEISNTLDGSILSRNPLTHSSRGHSLRAAAGIVLPSSSFSEDAIRTDAEELNNIAVSHCHKPVSTTVVDQFKSR